MTLPSGPVLITGITGQDGGYLVEQLASWGLPIHGVVRPGEAIPEHVRVSDAKIRLHALELRDVDAVVGLLDRIRPTTVFNLAGLSSVAQSWQRPVLATEINGVLVAALLDCLWRHQDVEGAEPIRFVQASSAEIYAGARESPQNEQTPLSPRSPYGSSKAFAHTLVQAYRERGLHASNAVLFNHESPRRPLTFVTRKITSTVAAIAAGRATELVLGNLDVRRDWGWAPDYVDAMVRMGQADEPEDYVVATGEAHSVGEFVAAAFAYVGIREWSHLVSTDAAFVRPTEAVELVGDASRARDHLGWRPTVVFSGLVQRMMDAENESARPVA